jgi:hypothetical protein
MRAAGLGKKESEALWRWRSLRALRRRNEDCPPQGGIACAGPFAAVLFGPNRMPICQQNGTSTDQPAQCETDGIRTPVTIERHAKAHDMRSTYYYRSPSLTMPEDVDVP